MEPKMKAKFVTSSKVKIFQNPLYKKLEIINRKFQKKLGGCDDNGNPKSSTVYVVK